jgi:hypothetical protein
MDLDTRFGWNPITTDCSHIAVVGRCSGPFRAPRSYFRALEIRSGWIWVALGSKSASDWLLLWPTGHRLGGNLNTIGDCSGLLRAPRSYFRALKIRSGWIWVALGSKLASDLRFAIALAHRAPRSYFRALKMRSGWIWVPVGKKVASDWRLLGPTSGNQVVL